LQLFVSIAKADEIHVLEVVIISSPFLSFNDFIAIINASVPEFNVSEYLHLNILESFFSSNSTFFPFIKFDLSIDSPRNERNFFLYQQMVSLL
jgi:hypothetical protein